MIQGSTYFIEIPPISEFSHSRLNSADYDQALESLRRIRSIHYRKAAFHGMIAVFLQEYIDNNYVMIEANQFGRGIIENQIQILRNEAINLGIFEGKDFLYD